MVKQRGDDYNSHNIKKYIQMSLLKYFNKSGGGRTCLTFCFFVVLYVVIIFHTITDIKAHAAIAIESFQSGNLFKGNFITYFLLHLFSLFTCNYGLMLCSAAFILACSFVFRVHLYERGLPAVKHRFLWALSLCFVFIIPFFFFYDRYYYMGYFVPNNFHNTTSLLLYPLAIYLFLLSFKQPKQYSWNYNIILTLLTVVGIYIKPSYFFVFVVSFPCLLLVRYGVRSRNFWLYLVPIAIGLVALYFQKVSIYDSTLAKEDPSGLYIGLIQTDILYILKGFSGLAFPFAYVVYYINEVKKDKLLLYALLQLIVSILIMYLCHETGPRANAGNFSWQIHLCTGIVFFVILKRLLEAKRDVSNKVFLSFYAINVFSGLFYIFYTVYHYLPFWS